MKNFKLLTLTLASAIIAAPVAFGQESSAGGNTGALDNPPRPGEPISASNPDAMMSEGVYGIFFEEDGTTMRSEEDAMAMYNEASAEDQEMVKEACGIWEEERVGFLDSVTPICVAVSDSEGPAQ